MRILLIQQYHHSPDCPASCRHYDLAERWSRRHKVTIISSTAWEERRLTDEYPWIPGSAELQRIPTPYSNKMGLTARANAFLSFAFGAFRTGRMLPAPDVVIGSSTPLTAAWAARRLARKWNVPFVFEVRDLWPDFPIDMGAIPKPFQAPLKYLERSLYRSADHVVALSPDIANHIAETGVPRDRITTLLHGTDLQAAAEAVVLSRRQPGPEESRPPAPKTRTVLYAGAFGRANDIPTILAAARKLSADRRIRFLFAGHGFHEDTIREAASELPNVELIGPVPRHRIFDLFANAFVSLVTFADVPSVAACSPSKMYDSLAAGCPVIVNSDGWTRRLVEENRCGWYVRAESPDQLAERLVTLVESPEQATAAASNAVRAARDGFDRGLIADRLEALLESAVAARKPTADAEPTPGPTGAARATGIAFRETAAAAPATKEPTTETPATRDSRVSEAA